MARPARVRVVTYNVWFGEFEFRRRADALLELVADQDADIIALQEVTPGFVQILSAKPWASDYTLSLHEPSDISPYGSLLMTRLPTRSFERARLWTYQGRELVTAELSAGLVVGTVHLESRRAAQEIRVTQLEQIFELLGDQPYILMGDMNFDAGAEEEEGLPPDCRDLWAALRPGDAGTTFDTELNEMAAVHASRHKQVRFDRIFLRCPFYRARRIQRLGLKALDAEGQIWPSDHFGLLAELELHSSPAGPAES